ncbi:hypothetical protein [Nocardia nova]|uniref:hypothetical protein n=1 Tax=Nocardia nova TaxID=37330 RepID=UPI0027394018|nr:hypothetical protein [Nocardia nova]
MTGVVVNPTHAHGFDRFERIGEGWRAWRMCGACWQAPTKAWASRLLHKHLSAEAREFRKVRNALRKQTIGGVS